MRSLLFYLLFGLSFSAYTCSEFEIQGHYEKLQKEAKTLAGSVNNFQERMFYMGKMFDDSNGNLIFPLVAGYGAKWANDFLKNVDLLIATSILFQVDRLKLIKKVKLLSLELKRTNKKVFEDFYSKYYLISSFPYCNSELQSLGISKDIISTIVKALKERELSRGEKLRLFESALKHEQVAIVSPALAQLEDSLKLTFLERQLLLRPIVRFDYFSRRTFFKFKNFFSEKERIHWAMESAKIALDKDLDFLSQRLQRR